MKLNPVTTRKVISALRGGEYKQCGFSMYRFGGGSCFWGVVELVLGRKFLLELINENIQCLKTQRSIMSSTPSHCAPSPYVANKLLLDANEAEVRHVRRMLMDMNDGRKSHIKNGRDNSSGYTKHLPNPRQRQWTFMEIAQYLEDWLLKQEIAEFKVPPATLSSEEPAATVVSELVAV